MSRSHDWYLEEVETELISDFFKCSKFIVIVE